MSINSFKVISSLIIFVLNALSSFLPFCFSSQSWVSYAESLAGGVFIGAFAVHLFPEALHSFSNYTHAPIGPIVSLIFFTILLSVEMFASSHGHGHGHDHNCSKHKCKHQDENTSVNQQTNIISSNNEISNSIDQNEEAPSDLSKENYYNDDSKMLIHPNESRFAVEEEIENLEEFRSTNLSTSKSRYNVKSTTLVVYFVLIFHCIIEAFGFGLLQSRSLLIALFCAIIGHKPVETFSMGILILQGMTKNGQNKKTNETTPNTTKNINQSENNNLYKQSKNQYGLSNIRKMNKFLMKKYIIMMIVFSSATPLTILFSMYFGSNIHSPLFFGFIAAASAGVFMFVGFHELTELMEESGNWSVKAKILHILWIVIGLGWMAIIGLFSEEHEH